MNDGHRMAALKLTLAPGWHTYWRAPGDAGIPPSFDWSKSTNLKAVAIHWPVPRTFDLGGLRSIGYEGGLVLPIELTPKAAGKPIALEAQIDIGVCKDICLPASLSLRADLSGPGKKGGAIRGALTDGPESAAKAGVKDVSCTVAPSADGLALTARLRMPPLPGKELTVVELPDPAIWVSEAKTTRQGDTLTAVADIVPPSKSFALDRSQLTITVLGQGRAVELHGCAG
ncbi:protein-disulfide reductase DsbD domain-containing protein [Acidimangrovimonas sediminis]|uniref:protein-disulfide reductase DsbD domain-containing protein n=1 Tax=Acidimangrovimonas sediminis TaxID=2056283 RepID=UPI001E60BABD|nr:protein-disulfide reductase DsbD domain-containing protein [Acidimangrovimonas sediminis]